MEKLKPIKYSLGLDQWHVFIEFRAENSWALTCMGDCMDKNGEFNDEPSPSNRTEDFIQNHRFKTPEDAYNCFKEKSKLIINGHKISI